MCVCVGVYLEGNWEESRPMRFGEAAVLPPHGVGTSQLGTSISVLSYWT